MTGVVFGDVALSGTALSGIFLPDAAIVALLVLAGCGHAIFWIGLVNRLHAVALPRPAMKLITALFYGLMLAIPVLWVRHGVSAGWHPFAAVLGSPGGNSTRVATGWDLYLLFSIAIAILRGPVWIVDRARHRPPAVVMRHHVRSVDLAAVLGRRPVAGLRAKLLARVPGNQVFRLDVDDEEVELARLPSALAGLSILHLSDFHFSGRIERDYFEQVVRIANDLEPDLVAVTGDICDVAACIDWVAAIFGELSAPLGKYFVLGNHDKRVKDVPRLRAAMAAAGCVDLAAGPRQVAHRGQTILLAGNELPWFPMPEIAAGATGGRRGRRAANPAGPFSRPISLGAAARFRPDAGRAHARGADLPAGHRPDRLPQPPRHPLCRGTFFMQPTLMHVSRGVSNLFPLRLRCPPEMTRLVLQQPATLPF